MALRVSTGLRKKIMAGLSYPSAAIVGTGISLVINSGGNDQLVDAASGFLTAGFKPGGFVAIFNATTPANDGVYFVRAVAAGTLTLDGNALSAAESLPANGCVVQSKGYSLAEILRQGIIKGFSGNQPTTADKATTGTPLIVYSLNAGAFVAGSPDNGLVWEDVGDGSIRKPLAASWQGLGIADGSLGWFRIYDNSVTEGDSLSAVRIDGAISITGAQMNGSSVTVRAGATSSLDTGVITLPTL